MAIRSIQLKHRDPIVYARAGEELAYFHAHGRTTLVLPGLSSASAVRLSFELCTGIGRQGKAVSPPNTDRTRTVLALVGIARPSEVVHALVTTEHGGRRGGPALPSCSVYPIVSTARCQTRGYPCRCSRM